MRMYSTLAAAMAIALVATPSLAFFGSDLKITKIRPAADPNYVQEHGVTRTFYQLDKDDLPALNSLSEESKLLPNLTLIDITQLDSIQPEKLTLAYNGAEASNLKTHYSALIDEMKQIAVGINAETQMKLEQKQKNNTAILDEIAKLETLKANYLADIQIVLDRQKLVDELLAKSESLVTETAIQLADKFNSLGPEIVGKKGIKPKSFEKVSIKYGNCKEALSISSSKIQTGTELEGYCFTTKIPVKKKQSEQVLSNTALMTDYYKLTSIIYNELIMQGEADNKAKPISGYRQEAKAFSRGTIRDAQNAAQTKYGTTDKGFNRKIKSLNTQYKQGLYNIESAKTNTVNNNSSALRQSDKFKALEPKAQQLNQFISQYLSASWQHILGKPVDEFTTDDYKFIELEPVDDITIVVDTYASVTETYLINSSKLDEIKDHRDIKGLDGIPTNVAARVDGLLIFSGTTSQPVSSDRLAKSSTEFLQQL